MAKAKKYLAVLLSSVITLSLIVIPGIMGVSAATDTDSILDVSGGKEGFVSFFEDLPLKDAGTENLSGAALETLTPASTNFAFLKASILTVNNTETFNNGENSFWFSGWKTKYNDLSQLAQNGYVELWVKASAAVEFEVRLSQDFSYYTQKVKVTAEEVSNTWQKVTLPFSSFEAKNGATVATLSNLRGIKIVFAQNNGLTSAAAVCFGSMSFFTSNTVDNGYVKVNEGELSFQDRNVNLEAEKVLYNTKDSEKFSYSKKLTFNTSTAQQGNPFDITFSSVTLGTNDYISFWARSDKPITTKYLLATSNYAWDSDVAALLTFGGDGVWKEYRIYGSEVSKISSVGRIRFFLVTKNLESNTQYSIEFSGFAVYSKIDPQNNIYATEKELSEVKTGGGATDNIYLENKEVTDSNGAAKTAYQVAVTNSAFYTNDKGASFIYYGCNQSWVPYYNISKITKDGYIKTYIKTEKPIKLLFSVWGHNWSVSKEFPVYISGSSEWQEILIPLSRLGATDEGFPLDSGTNSKGGSTIPYNEVYAFRWRVAQYATTDFLPVVTDGVYNDSNSVYFAPLEFVRMIHADLDNSRNLDSKDFALMKTALLGITEATVANADANADGNFDIADLVHLKKLLNEMTPVTVDMTYALTCGNGNGILLSDENGVLPEGTVINAFKNSTSGENTSLF